MRFVFAHPAHAIAFTFGAGLAPQAPGSFGTLAALPIFYFLQPRLDESLFFLALLAAWLTGVWACHRTGQDLGVADHGGMVWDETVAFLLVLALIPRSLPWQALAFLLFRIFDIAKPPPISYFDRSMKNGFGVMFDDLLAAGYTLLVLSIWKAIGA